VAKTGRPSKFSQKIADEICLRMADGESLNQILKGDGMPSRSMVMRWLRQDEMFRDNYTRAREDLLEHWSDHIVDIADDGSNDFMDRTDKDGEVIGELVNHEHITRSRLRVDTRKWLMSKLAPKKYGDQVAVTGAGGGPLTIEIVRFSDGEKDA